MGGRIASQLVATGLPVAGLILIGYPLHPEGRSEKLREEHLRRIPRPMLFITGSSDPLCTLSQLKDALDAIPAPTRLHVIPDGDHSLRVPRALGRPEEEIHRQIVDAISDWISEQPL